MRIRERERERVIIIIMSINDDNKRRRYFVDQRYVTTNTTTTTTHHHHYHRHHDVGKKKKTQQQQQLLPPPPPNTRYVERQAGGHCFCNGNDDILPNLQHKDGWFLKLLRDSPRYWNEVRFYRLIFEANCQERDVLAVKQLIPTYDGVYQTVINGKEANYIKLEDITHKYRFPCILDVKMKSDVHDPNSENEHVVSDLSVKMGFLLDGLQVYDMNTGKYVSYQKAFGRTLAQQEEVTKVLLQFVNGDGRRSKALIQQFVQRLCAVRKWAATQRRFTFYRSSLLLVYDAIALQQQETLDDDDVIDVRLVDFAKFYDSTETDHLYVRALDNLVQCFRHLLLE